MSLNNYSLIQVIWATFHRSLCVNLIIYWLFAIFFAVIRVSALYVLPSTNVFSIYGQLGQQNPLSYFLYIPSSKLTKNDSFFDLIEGCILNFFLKGMSLAGWGLYRLYLDINESDLILWLFVPLYLKMNPRPPPPPPNKKKTF